MSFRSSASDLSALFLGLHSDLNHCKSNLRDDGAGYWDRMYVRCLFAMIEGITYRIRHALLSAHDEKETVLESSEYMLLSETRYLIKENGVVKKSNEYQSFTAGFRFTFKTCCRVLGCAEYEQSAFSHNGWNCTQQTIGMRNRLTHPKNPSDLIVSRSEVTTAQDAEQWFMSLASEIFLRMRAKYDV